MRAKFLLSLISIVICFALAEAVLRATGKYATYTERTDTGGYVSPFDVGYVTSWYRVHTPGKKIEYANKEFSAMWVPNNEGLKDVNFTTVKKGYRIMVLGDSFTEGSGASNDSSYPQQLADLVRDSLSAEDDVWNCGVGGSDLFFEYVLFRDKLLKYKPDMAILTINNTDIFETEIRGGFERFGKDGKTHYKRGPWFEPLFAHSHLVRGVVTGICDYDWSFNKRSRKQQLQDSATAMLCVAMDSFAVLCKARNIKLVFVFHPMQNEVEKTEKYFADKQIAHCVANGYDYTDARDRFYNMGIDSANAGYFYWKNDGHFNSRGYHYLARVVWDKIRPELASDTTGNYGKGNY